MIVTVYLKYLCAPVLVSIFVSFWGSISFIRDAYICLSRVQHPLSARLVIFFFFLLIFKAHFLDSSRAHGAPAMRTASTAGLVQAWRGSIRHFSPFARRAATRGKSGGSLGMF